VRVAVPRVLVFVVMRVAIRVVVRVRVVTCAFVILDAQALRSWRSTSPRRRCSTWKTA
jgi:hypothetical protein